MLREGTEPNKGTVRNKKESPADSRRTKHWQEPWRTVDRHSDHLVWERWHEMEVLGKEYEGDDGRAKEPAFFLNNAALVITTVAVMKLC